jgi:hypothetical protein
MKEWMNILSVFNNYRNIILLKIIIISVPIILILISKFSKKNGYDNLSNETDYESIAINLYRRFIQDIRENKYDVLLKYCAKDIVMRIDINNLNFPVYVYQKFLTRSEKFIEYLFISFDSSNSVRRVILKIGRKDDQYMICGMEDEK